MGHSLTWNKGALDVLSGLFSTRTLLKSLLQCSNECYSRKNSNPALGLPITPPLVLEDHLRAVTGRLSQELNSKFLAIIKRGIWKRLLRSQPNLPCTLFVHGIMLLLFRRWAVSTRRKQTRTLVRSWWTCMFELPITYGSDSELPLSTPWSGEKIVNITESWLGKLGD